MDEWIAGTMIWINLTMSTKEWWKYVYTRSTRNAGVVFQTYLIHKQDDCGDTVSERWWTYQSNVHGVVIAAKCVAKDSMRKYPRTLGPVIEHFIPGLSIAESDFESGAHINVMKFLPRDKKKLLFQALEIGIQSLRQYFRSSKQRQDLRYAGHSYGIVATALQLCDEVTADSEDDEADSHILRVLQVTRAFKRCRPNTRMSRMLRPIKRRRWNVCPFCQAGYLYR